MPRQDVQFLHELSTPNELDRYYRHLEVRRQQRMTERDVWAELERVLIHDRQPQYIALPEAQNVFDFTIRGNHVRLFDTRIYIQAHMLNQIPAELQPRLEQDSLWLQLIDDDRHDLSDTLSPLLCGLWRLRNATGSWSSIAYQCIGCGIGETTHGNPTQA